MNRVVLCSVLSSPLLYYFTLAEMAPTNEGSNGSNNGNGEMDYTPLYMSLIAGMSTCLGAAWVLFQRTNDNNKGRSGPIVPPSTMCFSLALAGSVMITVSVVSIIPECMREEVDEHDDLSAVPQGYRMIQLWSTKFLYRLLFHAIGYILYFLLAKFAFPEPDEILGLTQQTIIKDDQNGNQSSSEGIALLDHPSRQITTADSNTSNTSDVEENRAVPTPSKKTARNRRTDKGVLVSNPSASMDSSADADNTKAIDRDSSSSHASNHNTIIDTDDDGNDKDKKPQDFFRSLSRYSSGADLDTQESRRAWRVAMLLFVSLTVHNFPEGLAVAASAMESKELGIKVMIGIMVHNVPEGVSIAVPCLAARPDSPWLAFWLSAFSGLAEPFGAFVALFALRNIDNRDEKSEIVNMENVLAFVAGIMIMVALAELFPEAKRHTKEGYFHFWAGTVAGIVLMLATELYLA